MNEYILLKRGLDIVLAIIILIILSPLLLLLSLLIKIDSPGPVFFKQNRTGLNGKDFAVIKFRSMVKENDVFDFEKGDQITRVGKFIRKLSLDELPQLFNILRGEMSFIGPRPWLPILNQYYTEYQKKRFDVKPGITGLAQVSGRKDLNIIDRINYDIEYVNNISFLLDMKIFLKTIIVIFKSSDNTRKKYTLEDEITDLKNNYYSVLESNNFYN